MGGSLSTIRWTPYGPLPGTGGNPKDHRGRSGHPLRKSKSFPPATSSTGGGGGEFSSPSNSTSNLSGSYDNNTDGDDELYQQSQHGGDHLGTSGILMGVNAPPLYDACLVGRWDEVLEICGASAAGGEGDEGHMSDDSPKTGTTHCSSSVDEDPGFPESGIRQEEQMARSPRRQSQQQQQQQQQQPQQPADDSNNNDALNSSIHSTSHPCLQTRYADRRRNTPLHLACRRQPPPSVVRALLNHSPCEAVSRRTADGLTPLHFAAYCGAEVEVISLLVDRMRSDAAVGRAMRLSSALAERDAGDSGKDQRRRGDGGGRTADQTAARLWRPPSEESMALPSTRLLDRRRRTPLHCALSGFRTPIRPLVVRKLLAVDPASATLSDERNRTPLSLLFDDYAEEVMEALEDDVPPGIVREKIKRGGELHECWKMLRVLLQAAYRGGVSEDDDLDTGGRKKAQGVEDHRRSERAARKHHQQRWDAGLAPAAIEEGEVAETAEQAVPAVPQDRHHLQTSIKEVNVDEMYNQKQFSMVHAAAGVWECPAPLAKLVLKCLCGTGRPSASEAADDYEPIEFSGFDGSDATDPECVRAMLLDNSDHGGDPIRQPDEETMRLPLHIAVCARPQAREGYSARLKVWLSSASKSRRDDDSSSSMHGSVSGMSTTASIITHPDRGRSVNSVEGAGRVYNPRFGRSPSRDSVVAYSSSERYRRQTGEGGADNNSMHGTFSASSSSIATNIAREPFLQHTMVRDVLQLYPDAASVVDNRTGKLPIVLAIEHGKSWETAIGPLLEAYPNPFGGGGHGGMALPDDSPDARSHREALQSALFLALSSPESHERDEAIRTVGKLAKWGGVYGMPGSLDAIVIEWLTTIVNQDSANAAKEKAAEPASPEGIVVGPGVTPISNSEPSASNWIQTQTSHLTAVAEVLSHAHPESISDRVARLCLDTSREYLFSKDGTVREAAARVLGNTLNSVGDADDAANVMREVVLKMANEDGSVYSSSSSITKGFRVGGEDAITKHGRLLGCHSILITQWGGELMSTQDISDAIITLVHRCVKDKNTVIRSAAYHIIGPLLGKCSTTKDNHHLSSPKASPMTSHSLRTTTSTLREMRSDILKGTRASEHVDVQLALARALTSASRMQPNLFLCKGGMPIMDAALMLAMSSSVKRPNVQKAFQIFLWVALQIRGGGMEDGHDEGRSMSPGLQKYVDLAEGENGGIMLKFVTQTLAKIDDLDDHGG